MEKEMATHSSVLAWRIPGTGEPGGLPPTGSHRVGHDWSDLAAAAAAAGRIYIAGLDKIEIIDIHREILVYILFIRQEPLLKMTMMIEEAGNKKHKKSEKLLEY